jgi:endonuclease/exonuclease/phosphatase family metal-dependent hydrolase
MHLRLVSWNVHGCVGTDRRFDPERTAAVLGSLRPDVALLQEVGDSRGIHPPVDQAQSLASALGLTCALGITLPGDPHGYGNATLTRLPVLDSEIWDLSVRGREPRCCLRVVVGHDDFRLTTVNVHLGLGLHERKRQLDILLEEALEGVDGPMVMGGDFNDFPPGRVSHALASRFRDVASRLRPRCTFPSGWPFLRLDRVYALALGVARVSTDRSPEARAASDHLPLVVDLDVPEMPSSGAADPP